jgi:hypothetical protein
MAAAILSTPMPRHPCAAARARRSALASCLVLVIGLAACSTAEPGPATATPSATQNAPGSATPSPPSTPSLTPQPTPRFTNQPDPALEALIPATIAGAKVQKPTPNEYGITPGDFGMSFGDLGLRFESLVLAFIEHPRLSLFAARVSGTPVDTSSLRPYLAAAGQYVGIAGLHPEAWHAVVVGGKQAWKRGDDPATLPGTTLYCWSSGQYVFLLTGSSDAANMAMVKALPGQPAPTPTPRPTTTPRSGAASGAASPSTRATTSPSAS